MARRARRRAGRRCSSPPTTSSSRPAFADRVVLLGDGELIADGPPTRSSPAAGTSPPRSRGSSAATARSRPRRAPACCARRSRADAAEAAPMSWQVAVFALLGAGRRRRLRLVRARPAAGPAGRAGRGAGGARGRRAAGAGADPERGRDHRHRPAHRLRARRAAGVRGRRAGAPISNIWLGQGPWTRLADGRLGPGRARSAPGSRWSTGRRLGRLGLAVACASPASPTAPCSTSR